MTKAKPLQNRKTRQVLSLIVSLLMVGLIAVIGVRLYGESNASTGATLSVSPASGSFAVGSNVAMTISMDSGTEPVNSVQASLTYNASQLQYVSITEGGSFPLPAATSTDAGVIRVARALQDGSVSGRHSVVTVNFKVLAAATATSVGLDPAYSFVVRSTDNKNILASATGGTYTFDGGGQSGESVASGQPVFTLNPVSGNYPPGSTVAVSVRVRSNTAAITTVQPIVAYPADKLEYVNVTEGGVFPTVQRTKHTAGTVDIIRGVSGGSKGVTGDQPIVTINFKVIGSGGSTALSFAGQSAAYDNSGTGKNVLDLSASTGASYALSASSAQTQTPNGRGPAIILPKAGGRTVQKNGTTQFTGQVEILPVVNEAILQKTPGDTIIKVEYFIGKKLVSTQKMSPFTYGFDTASLKNGAHDITIKTHYKSGTVDSSKDQLLVSNPVNGRYVMRHYGPSIVWSVVLLAGFALIAWRYLLPRFGKRPGDAELAVVPAANTVTGTSGADRLVAPITPVPSGPVAPAPTVIMPAGYITPVGVESAAPDAPAVQTTSSLPLNVPAATVAAPTAPVPAPNPAPAPPAPDIAAVPTVLPNGPLPPSGSLNQIQQPVVLQMPPVPTAGPVAPQPTVVQPTVIQPTVQPSVQDGNPAAGNQQ